VADVVASCAVPLPAFTNLDLVTMGALLAQLDLYVGHDSGLTHLAAALHRPTLALFGPTQAQRWAPQGSHVRILAGSRCGCATWAEVQACPDKPCLQISVDRLVYACEEMIHQRGRLDVGLVWRGLAPCSDR
jgi:ADP-heptose:LPS heptosyltransferase